MLPQQDSLENAVRFGSQSPGAFNAIVFLIQEHFMSFQSVLRSRLRLRVFFSPALARTPAPVRTPAPGPVPIKKKAFNY